VPSAVPSSRPGGSITLTLALAGLLVASAVPLAAGPAAAQTFDASVSPDDIVHGDARQSMEVFVRNVDTEQSFVVNVTPLAAAGVDLSAASARAVNLDRDRLRANATLVGSANGTARVRVRVAPASGDPIRDGEFRLVLDDLNTTDAAHTRLSYPVTYADVRQSSPRFDLADPELPWVGPLTRTDWLVTGRANASQPVTVSLLEVPVNTSATVRIDLSPLSDRGVSLTNATLVVRDRPLDATVRDVGLNGSVATFTLRTDTRDPRVDVVVRGVDTRGASPADPLRYPVTVGVPAGTVTDSTKPFGLYAPTDTPTPTPPPTPDLPTTTRPPTDSNGPDRGEGPPDTTTRPATGSPTPSPHGDRWTDHSESPVPGFEVVVTVAAIGLATLVYRHRS
jgi:hypothetical protein